MFWTQVGFSAVTLAFCITMIVRDPSASNVSIFLPLVSSISSLYIPAPTYRRKPTLPGTTPEETQSILTGYDAV